MPRTKHKIVVTLTITPRAAERLQALVDNQIKRLEKRVKGSTYLDSLVEELTAVSDELENQLEEAPEADDADEWVATWY